MTGMELELKKAKDALRALGDRAVRSLESGQASGAVLLDALFDASDRVDRLMRMMRAYGTEGRACA